MYLLRTIQADPNSKTHLCKKMAPILAKERAIRLNPIYNLLMAWLIFSLKRYNLTEVINPEKRRFASMPWKLNHRIGGSFYVLLNIALQNGERHAKRLSFRLETLSFQVVAILTCQIASVTNWLNKDLKWSRCLSHLLLVRKGQGRGGVWDSFSKKNIFNIFDSSFRNSQLE